MYFAASSRHRPYAYTVFHRRLLPALYDDPEAEYWALVTGVVLWDVGTEIPLEVSGPDALRFLDWVTTRDLTRCPVGRCRYVFVTDDRGGIVNDPVVLRLAEDRFWLMPSDSDLGLWLKALAYAQGFRVTLTPVDTAPLQVRGPKARAVICALFGPQVGGLLYYHFAETRLDGIPVVVTRTGFSGELGYELMPIGASRVGPAFWERVEAAGRPHGMRVTGPSQIRRIEAGIFAYGVDMTLETIPLELTGYEWMVDFRKPDFVGRQALLQAATEGVRRKMVGIELEGERPPELWGGLLVEPLPVFAPGGQEPIGRVTSACASPQLRTLIGFAQVPVEYAALGTQLEVATRSGRRGARVVPKPFLDPQKTRSRM